MVAGVIVAVLTKGLKKKGLIVVGLVVIYTLTFISNEALIRSVNAETNDKYRESLSFYILSTESFSLLLSSEVTLMPIQNLVWRWVREL